VCIQLKQTRHGCCPDGQTPASGPHHDGCPQTSTSRSPDCSSGKGCDEDSDETEEPETVTDQPTIDSFTSGSHEEVAEVIEDFIIPVTAVSLQEAGCLGSMYACCDDNVTPREGWSKLAE
jgi:papilin